MHPIFHVFHINQKMLLLQKISKAQLKQLNFASYFSQAKPAAKKKTYYQILQTPSSASQASIRKNYLKLAKLYHPDVYKGADKTRFEKIQQAYKVLNNVNQRRKYDQSIGQKGAPGQQNYQFNAEVFKDSQKPRNDFDYSTESSKPKQELNIDQQYEKFFKKKPQTHFEQIRMHEDAQFKRMTVQERVRRTMSTVYQDSDKEAYKKKYQKTFPQILDDHIKQKNDSLQDQIKKQQKIVKRFSLKNIKRQRYLFYSIALISAIFFYQFMFDFTKKVIAEKRMKNNLDQILNKVIQVKESDIVRSRMVF